VVNRSGAFNMSKAFDVSKSCTAILTFIAVLTASGCTSSKAGPNLPTTSTAVATSTTIAARKITKFTGGNGDAFCAAFSRASNVLAISAISAVGKPDIANENELLIAPALTEPLSIMKDATPQETSDGVREWNNRNEKALGAFRRAGASAGVIDAVNQRVASLTAATVRRGPLAQQVGDPVDQTKLTSSAIEFAKGQTDFETFTAKLSFDLGGVLVGEAREQALKEFPCLAALDAGTQPSVPAI
jgi:hypothetical protein